MNEKQLDRSQLTRDTLRAVVMGAVTATMIRYVLENKEHLPGTVNMNILRDTVGQLKRFEREIRKGAGETNTYLDNRLNESKMYNIETIVDLMIRIGTEEKTDKYELFCDMMLDCIHAVLYSQEHRRNIYIPKYQALFKLFIEEMKRDTHKEQEHVLLHNGELYLRTGIAKEPQIKIANDTSKSSS